MTHTFGQPSGVITDGLGFMYNGAMAVFDPQRGHRIARPRQVALLRPVPNDRVQERPAIPRARGAGRHLITMGNLQVIVEGRLGGGADPATGGLVVEVSP